MSGRAGQALRELVGGDCGAVLVTLSVCESPKNVKMTITMMMTRWGKCRSEEEDEESRGD